MIRPLAFTVMFAFVKEPTFALTVASVRVVAPVASPVCDTLYLFVHSLISSVSRTTTPVCQFTESTAHPPPPHAANSRPVSSAFTFANLPACQA